VKRLTFAICLAITFAAGWVLGPSLSPATITLTTPISQTGPNMLNENDPYSGPMGICADQVKQTLTFTIYPITAQTTSGGKVTGVTAGTLPSIVMSVNTSTGAWSTSTGLTGTLTGSSLTGAQAWLAAALTSTMKNQAETAWISMGILPGTQTPWQ
jgi:hypothetical protein